MPNPLSSSLKRQRPLKIVAFLRPVHNPAFSLEPVQAAGLEELPGYRPMPDPLSEAALETALGLRDASPAPAVVIACSAGSDPCRSVLREALACGADEALWIECPTSEPDGRIVAAHLNAAFRGAPLDLGLFGARDLDTQAGQIGPMFSALAGVPFLDGVIEIAWAEGMRIVATRSRGPLRERILLSSPACVAVQRSRPLRYPTLEGKVRSERTPLPPRTVDPGRVAPLVLRDRFTPPKPTRASAAADYARSSSLDRIRQAYGMAAGADPGASEAMPQPLRPPEAARKILEILTEERFIDPGREDA